MKITILTDNINSWILPYVEQLKKHLEIDHTVSHIFDVADISKGDIMFLLSCERILKPDYLKFHTNNIVVHPSKLPQGKGWSPLAWQILEGKNKIPISLFEAVEQVDAGNVYILDYIHLDGHELNDEIKHKQGLITIKLVREYLNAYGSIHGSPQAGAESFYRKRKERDNELDIDKSIRDQFNLLRIVDNERYPAHFHINNQKYILKVYRDDKS